MTPICPYCGKPAEFLSSSAPLYANSKNYGAVWACLPCGAWVGCHAGTTKPLGRLADQKLRYAKMRAHYAFDHLWQRKMERDGISKSCARSKAYKWLASQLDVAECHIGEMDVETCERVVEICRPYSGDRND